MLKTNILFVDANNNGRSIYAEAYFNEHMSGSSRAFSAGVQPAEKLDKIVLDILIEKGLEAEDYCPKPVDIFLQAYSPRIDMIVGFRPMIEPFKLPIFTHQPPVTYLSVDPVADRLLRENRRAAHRHCFADVMFAIDRALAKGQLPGSQAA